MHTCKRADVSTSRGVVSLRLFFRVSRPRRASVPIFLPVFAKVGVAYRGCLRATGNQETRAEIGRFVGGCPLSLRFHTAPRTCLLRCKQPRLCQPLPTEVLKDFTTL